MNRLLAKNDGAIISLIVVAMANQVFADNVGSAGTWYFSIKKLLKNSNYAMVYNKHLSYANLYFYIGVFCKKLRER